MLAATRIAVPRSLFRRGLRLKSSMMLAMMRCLRSPALINSSIVAQRLRRTAFWKLFSPLVFCSNHASMAACEVRRCGTSRASYFRSRMTLSATRLVKLVGVDVGAEDVARHLLVLAQERRAGEADEDRVLQPALHLLVHVAALGAVAFVHEHVEPAVDGRRRALEVGGVELVDQRAQQAGRGGPELRRRTPPAR